MYFCFNPGLKQEDVHIVGNPTICYTIISPPNYKGNLIGLSGAISSRAEYNEQKYQLVYPAIIV